jgi:phosphoribosylanthranilate isomerase
MVKIKICGLIRAEDIAAANNVQPDYIGFVFAKSRRQVSPEKAAELRRGLAAGIQAVGVFVNEPAENVARLAEGGVIDIIQLHGDEDEAYLKNLRQLTDKPIIKAVRVQSPEQILRAEALPCDMLLLDTYTPGQYGGSGQMFDRSLLPKLTKPWFMAGGLAADNLAAAVRECGENLPYAVDVSSGAETDGIKDAGKMLKLVQIMRGLGL